MKFMKLRLYLRHRDQFQYKTFNSCTKDGCWVFSSLGGRMCMHIYIFIVELQTTNKFSLLATMVGKMQLPLGYKNSANIQTRRNVLGIEHVNGSLYETTQTKTVWLSIFCSTNILQLCSFEAAQYYMVLLRSREKVAKIFAMPFSLEINKYCNLFIT